ncbi:MAG: sigma-70 family RNA polymerase sigma factor [Planctomycetota bacterium]|nr:sigma-70 family RNA polymerase sigma factor [Planctomycetota bacterium]
MSHEPTRFSLLVRLRDPQDGEAWERFVRIYLPPVFRMAKRYGLNEADAADAAQDVLTAVHQRIGTFVYDPAKGTFRGWLKTVARSRICDLLDTRRRQPNGTGGSEANLRLEALPAAEEDDPWERDYRQGLFDAALEQVRREVEPPTLKAFVRCAIEAAKPADVAREMELSVGAVYIAKSRVTARIREIIADWEREEQDHGC